MKVGEVVHIRRGAARGVAGRQIIRLRYRPSRRERKLAKHLLCLYSVR